LASVRASIILKATSFRVKFGPCQMTVDLILIMFYPIRHASVLARPSHGGLLVYLQTCIPLLVLFPSHSSHTCILFLANSFILALLAFLLALFGLLT
jgi:hypothetical protein